MGSARVDRGEFERLSEAGWSIPKLAEHFGIAHRSVSRLRTQIGAPGRSPGLDATQLATVKDMLEDGMSQREISRTTGINRETIRAHFPGSGWNLSEAKTFGNEVFRLEKRIEKANYVRNA